MIRQLWLGYLHGANTPAAIDWYYNTHAAEFVRWFGAWLRRYETYVASVPPGAIRTYGILPGRYTEIWWTSKDEFLEANPLESRPYTALPGSYAQQQVFGALTITAAKPDHDFLGKEPNPGDPIIRWIRVFKYPAISHPEIWYLSDYAPSVTKLVGNNLLRYVSYKTLDQDKVVNPTSGTAQMLNPFQQWDRVDELWFSDFSAWQTAFLKVPKLKPGVPDSTGFAAMSSNFVSVKPDKDFLST